MTLASLILVLVSIVSLAAGGFASLRSIMDCMEWCEEDSSMRWPAIAAMSFIVYLAAGYALLF